MFMQKLFSHCWPRAQFCLHFLTVQNNKFSSCILLHEVITLNERSTVAKKSIQVQVKKRNLTIVFIQASIAISCSMMAVALLVESYLHYCSRC